MSCQTGLLIFFLARRFSQIEFSHHDYNWLDLTWWNFQCGVTERWETPSSMIVLL